MRWLESSCTWLPAGPLRMLHGAWAELGQRRRRGKWWPWVNRPTGGVSPDRRHRDLHPREVVQEITRAVLRAVDGKLRDDATALCLDWYGGGERDRQVKAGANQASASPPQADV